MLFWYIISAIGAWFLYLVACEVAQLTRALTGISNALWSAHKELSEVRKALDRHRTKLDKEQP